MNRYITNESDFRLNPFKTFVESDRYKERGNIKIKRQRRRNYQRQRETDRDRCRDRERDGERDGERDRQSERQKE